MSEKLLARMLHQVHTPNPLMRTPGLKTGKTEKNRAFLADKTNGVTSLRKAAAKVPVKPMTTKLKVYADEPSEYGPPNTLDQYHYLAEEVVELPRLPKQVSARARLHLQALEAFEPTLIWDEPALEPVDVQVPELDGCALLI